MLRRGSDVRIVLGAFFFAPIFSCWCFESGLNSLTPDFRKVKEGLGLLLVLSMKIIRRIIIWFCIVLIFASIGVAFYIRNHGKQYLQDTIEQVFDKKIQIESLTYTYPLSLRATIVGLEEAREVVAFVNLKTLIHKKVHIQKLLVIDPIFNIDKLKDSLAQKDLANIENKHSVKDDNQKTSPKGLMVMIDEIEVQNGTLSYSHNSKDVPHHIVLDGMNLTAKNIIFPLDTAKIPFQVEGQLSSNVYILEQCPLKGVGWIDTIAKDMEAVFYVQDVFGKADLKAEIHSRANEMDVTVSMQLEKTGEDQKIDNENYPANLKDIAKSMINLPGVMQIETEFSFKTQMDRFRIPSKLSFSGKVVTN